MHGRHNSAAVAAEGNGPANAGANQCGESRAIAGPHLRTVAGPFVTAFSRHLPVQLLPPLARRDAFPEHGLPEPCLSMPATVPRKAPRVSPFRSGCRGMMRRNGRVGMEGEMFCGKRLERKDVRSETVRAFGAERRASPLIRPCGPPSPRRGEETMQDPQHTPSKAGHRAATCPLVLLPAGEKCRSEARR